MSLHSVLIVEDNTDLRSLYNQAVEMKGHKPLLAANGLEALQILRSDKKKPSLIVLDLMMPVMDGWEFLRHQSADPQLSEIPVVICSASKEAMPAEIEVIRKPVDLEVLLQILDKYTDNSSSPRE